MEKLKVTVETIDKQKAEELLKLNKSNRPVSWAVVNSYAETMRKGKWYLNGEAIKIDADGNLSDGQHRLYAVVKSEATIQTLVVREVPTEAFASYDCGRNRTPGQLMGMMGIKNYNAVSAIVKTRFMLRNHMMSFDNRKNKMASTKRKLTNDDVMTLFKEDQQKYEQYGQRAVSMRNRLGKTTIVNTFLAAVWMHLVEDLGYSQQFVDYFFENATSQESCSNQLVNCVRKMLTYEKATNIDTMEYKVNRLFKAWNKYANGECEMTKLTWGPNKEGQISLLPNNKH